MLEFRQIQLCYEVSNDGMTWFIKFYSFEFELLNWNYCSPEKKIIMGTWRIILLMMSAYMIKQCDSYRDLECYVGSHGECQFKEVGPWKSKIGDVKVSRGIFRTIGTVGYANLENFGL
jgi:hypothetical protein